MTSSLPPEAQGAIEEEEQCLRTALDSLSYQLQQSSRKLSSESKKARELTSQLVAAQTEEDKALLASDEAVAHAISHKKADDIEVLKKQIEKPYFARFVLAEDGADGVKEYEYKLGFSANPDCRIIDWRKAPISKLYYEYREGDEYCEEVQGIERRGTVRLRNAVDIEDSELKKLSCRYGSFIREKDQWRPLDSRKVRGDRLGTLPDVLSLITSDQFRTITEDAETAILIQGIAGSGKTTVALHRLAWLLHAENSALRPERCAVIVLSRILKAYVQNFLPSIGVHGVPIMTFHEWTKQSIARRAPALLNEDGDIRRPRDVAPHRVQRVLRSMALLTALERQENKRFASHLRGVERDIEWSSLPAGLRKILDDGLSQNVPPQMVLKQLADGTERGLQAIKPQHPLYGGLRTLSERLAPAAPAPQDLVVELLSKPDEIIAEDETRLLDRALLEEARTRCAQNLAAGVLDYAMDALLVRVMQLHNHDERGRHDHIVVDEVQDFSPVDLAGIIEAVKDRRQLTLVGDVAQKIHETAEFPGWKKLMTYWNFKESISRYVTLTVSHRSTLPIMRLAEHVQGERQVTHGRPGRVPIWFKTRLESKGIRAVIDWLNLALERYPTSITAVLTPTVQDAKYALSLLEPSFGAAVRLGDENCFSFEEGILVTDVLHAKGLEFTNVLLWNPSAQSYPGGQLGRNMLYTAITRAEENLCLVTWKRPSPLLPPLHSKLVRGINLSEEEEEAEEQSD